MNTLDAIFRPRSIALIGASSKDRSIGKEIVRNLVSNQFQGTVFPVNPNARVVHSIKCYPEVSEIPDAVDLAVIVVPSRQVLDVAEACGRKGVRGLVVISAGFKEIGPEGRTREENLLEILRRYGMRMVGPNCMGVINTQEEFRLDATFAPTVPIPGNVGFMSQSGALGVAILDIAREIGLGISMFASMGNKTDVSGNDLLEYWKDDERTKLILMYLESFGNPRKFTRIAREVSKRKPILCVKSGRTAQGATAASSHTGALASSLDVAVDALLEKCGVIRVATIDELFHLAIAFDAQPLPQDSRVAIVTNAGGPAIMATDALVHAGLTLATLDAGTKRRLKEFLPPEASVNNPVDMIASADESSYCEALQLVLGDPGVDAVLVIFVPPIMINANEVARAIVDVHRQFPAKTILACFMAQREAMAAIEMLKAGHIPVYSFPEPAVHALSMMDRYRRWRDKPEIPVPTLTVDSACVEKTLASAAPGEYLDWSQTHAVLSAYGFPLAPASLFGFDALQEAMKFQKAHGPVAAKLVGRSFIHKTEAGGVRIDLRTEEDLQSAFVEFRAIAEKTGIGAEAILVQQMRKGKELVMGMHLDKDFGPLIMFGLGGVYVEVLRDISFNIAPLSRSEAEEMVRSIKGFPILSGVRGQTPVDLESIIDTLLRLSRLVSDHPRISELDINPFMSVAGKSESTIVDARIRVL